MYTLIVYRQVFPTPILDAIRRITLSLWYMNYRIFFLTLTALLTVVFPGTALENRVLNFGPDSGPGLIVTTPERENSSAVAQLNRFAQKLTEKAPSLRISVIITENDFSVLPTELRTGYPEGTNHIISLLEEGDTRAVILLLPGDKNSVLIRNGIQERTSPRWILEKTAESLERLNRTWDLENIRMPLYRIGWIPENDLLAAYLRADVPALILETDSDVTDVLLDMANTFSADSMPNTDRHYLVLKYNNHLYFAGEELMVFAMNIALALILFSIFIFSFLFGQKGEQHRRELFHLWWLPFIYLAVNILCLYIGQILVSFLFAFRFGNSGSWILIPEIAFAGKLILSSFFITVIISLNQLIHFPEDNFIYGYIASIVCMINIFVFSSLDFSLSLLFLTVYFISFVAYHVHHPLSQVIGIILLFIPFSPYLLTLFTGGSTVLAPLYSGANFWNVRMALFVMPFQLMFSRLFHTMGIFGRKERFYIPVNLVIMFASAIFVTGLVLFIPAWSARKPLLIPVRETIDEKGRRIATVIPVVLRNLVLEPKETPAAATVPSEDPASYVDIQSTSQLFLDRQLVNISIRPSIPVQKIEVTIESENGLSVYAASFPFELRSAGMESFFSTSENPEVPMNINFSSDRNSILTAIVRVWTRANPEGLVIKNASLTTDFLLEIVRTVKLTSPTQNGKTQ